MGSGSKFEPVQYKQMDFKNRSGTQHTLLVKHGEEEVVNTIMKWKANKAKVDKLLISQWTEEGKAFPMDSTGIESLHKSEKKYNKQNFFPPERPINPKKFYGIESYINYGTKNEPILMKTSNAVDLDSKDITLKQIKNIDLNGGLFSNLTELFMAEKVHLKSNVIAYRIREFPIVSKEWKRWTNITAQHQATSLQQVIGEYFRDHSIGDCGGTDEIEGYVRTKGYAGTLAPGQNFAHEYPMDSLPKQILHPWPAMQEIPFHVRWPSPHPMIPPPLYWIGLNDMYTYNLTATILAAPPTNEYMGGIHMDSKDGLLIARNGEIGRHYIQSEQIAHGGMIFPHGHKLPHYNPDHGPTVSAEEALAPLTPAIKRMLNRFPDALLEYGQVEHDLPVDSQHSDEWDEEESFRRMTANQLLHLIKKEMQTDQLDWEIEDRRPELEFQLEVESRLKIAVEARRQAMEEEHASSLDELYYGSFSDKTPPDVLLRKALDPNNELGDDREVRLSEASLLNGEDNGKKRKMTSSIPRSYVPEPQRTNRTAVTSEDSDELKKFEIEIRKTIEIEARHAIEMRASLEERRPRTRAQLMRYGIESSALLIEETMSLQQNMLKKKKGKRKRRKDTTTDASSASLPFFDSPPFSSGSPPSSSAEKNIVF